MVTSGSLPMLSPAQSARAGDAAYLAQALLESRQDTLAVFARIKTALPDLLVPQRPELNPPLWELGHIGWFQDYWITRNPERDRGRHANPDCARPAPQRGNADALYHSSQVPHGSRWSLALPDPQATRADLAAQMERTLQMLSALKTADDDQLYFYRLALLHEDMHHEAALYMAQALGLPLDDARWQIRTLLAPGQPLQIPAQEWRLGTDTSQPGFAFDNEVGEQWVGLGACAIDAQVLRWAEYLPFVEAGAYGEARLWSDAGWHWRLQDGPDKAPVNPRYLRQQGGVWQQWRHGQWHALDLNEPACHLTYHEAQAWCRWAHRRLPTEAEWACAAHTLGPAFAWGDVWEWTASAFAPYPGFTPHPYRDYSAPWFDGRPVLRGASFMTQPRMRHPDYRNFFQAHRSDVPAGFRTCAV